MSYTIRQDRSVDSVRAFQNLNFVHFSRYKSIKSFLSAQKGGPLVAQLRFYGVLLPLSCATSGVTDRHAKFERSRLAWRFLLDPRGRSPADFFDEFRKTVPICFFQFWQERIRRVQSTEFKRVEFKPIQPTAGCANKPSARPRTRTG